MTQVAAQLFGPFYEMHWKSLSSQCQRGTHPCCSTTDDQCGVVDRHCLGLQRRKSCGARYCHPHQ